MRLSGAGGTVRQSDRKIPVSSYQPLFAMQDEADLTGGGHGRILGPFEFFRSAAKS
jgi:hypothetical protein